jgi:hypothetical protein
MAPRYLAISHLDQRLVVLAAERHADPAAFSAAFQGIRTL